MNKKERDKRKRRVVSAKHRAEAAVQEGGGNSLTMPEGLSFWQPKEGTHRISVVPYEIVDAGANPYAKDSGAEAGDLYMERTFYTHRVPTPDGKTKMFCCLSTFGEGNKCPVCKHRGELARDPDADEQLVKDLNAKVRQLWLVFDHDNADKGVQLWDISFHNFGKFLDAKVRNADDEDNYDNYADPENGLMIKVHLAEKSIGKGQPFLQADDIELKPRKNALPEEIVNHGYDLDAIPKRPDLKQLAALLSGEAVEDEDEEEDEKPKRTGKPSSNGKAKAEEDEEDEDEEEEDEGESEAFECSIGDTVSFKYKGKTLTGEVRRILEKKNLMHVQVGEEAQPRSVALDDPSLEMAEEEEDEDEDEEPAPKKVGKKTPAKAGRKSSKDDEEDEEEEEDSEDGDDWEDEDDE